MKKFHLDVSVQTSLTYLIFGFLWIIFSDQVLDMFVHNTSDMTRIQSFKGWAYVTVSAILIYGLIRRYLIVQKRYQDQLDESEERLRLAVTSANEGIFDVNLLTNEVIVNNIYAQLLGYDPNTFHETVFSWLDRMHPDDRDRVNQLFLNYSSGLSNDYHVEFRQKTASSKWIWILSVGKIVEFNSTGQPSRMLGTFTDISEIKNEELIKNRLLEESQRRLERITSLHEIDLEISSSTNLTTTLDKIVINVKKHLDVDAVSILLYEEKDNEFRYADSIGFKSKRIENARVKMGGSFAGIAAQKGKLIHIHDLEDDSVDEAFASLMRQEKIKNYLGVPLRAKGNLIGVLELFLRKDITPDDEWLDFFETLAGQAALAIENAQLIHGLETVNNDISRVNLELVSANQNLISAYDATIESLALALNLRDYETEEHSRRVTTMTLELAKMMGFTPEELVNIHRGTLLHDIGKLGVPDAILRKPGLLTEEERLVMQQHPIFAYNLLESIEYLKPALDIPHLHHEKWDGTGYPHGLEGNNIPMSARLFAIVDVYDALTSDRPYRKAWTKQDAKAYIQDQSGKHFDPHVVSVFLSFLENHPY